MTNLLTRYNMNYSDSDRKRDVWYSYVMLAARLHGRTLVWFNK